MKDKNQYIEELLEKFYNGATTNAEERELAEFFAEKDSAAVGSMPHAALFRSLTDDRLHAALKISDIADGGNPRINKVRHFAWRWSVAAAVPLFAFFAIELVSLPKEPNPFEGSYMVIDGKKITDLDAIMPQLTESLAESLRLEQELDQVISDAILIDQFIDYTDSNRKTN